MKCTCFKEWKYKKNKGPELKKENTRKKERKKERKERKKERKKWV